MNQRTTWGPWLQPWGVGIYELSCWYFIHLQERQPSVCNDYNSFLALELRKLTTPRALLHQTPEP